jgi:diguanylate cyclase
MAEFASDRDDAVKPPATDTDNWRQKYFDGLTSLENEQRKFRAMEAALKRLAGRLCTASLGQSERLDEQIKRLQSAIRRDVTSEELDQITPALTDAIQALDASPQSASKPSIPKPTAPAATSQVPTVPPAAAPAIAAPAPITANAAPPKSESQAPLVDERVRAILSALLFELRRDPELIKSVEALDAKLAGTLTREEFPEVLGFLAETVGRRIKRIEQAKQEVEVLLSHMVGKLDEIGQFVAEQNRSQNESHASSETLNVQLAVEMKAMGESVDAAHDLQQIRAQVRNRIDSVDRHLQQFREREAMLASAMRTRNEQMRTRIAELEGEANRLHAQLKDEQRLSTLDVLTKIPNRLAYEKRLDEELQRWQRFKQPTWSPCGMSITSNGSTIPTVIAPATVCYAPSPSAWRLASAVRIFSRAMAARSS